jgi:hypothetical protein
VVSVTVTARPQPTSDASLTLDWDLRSGYVHLTVAASGIPVHHSAKFTYTLTEVADWSAIGRNHSSACGDPSIGADGTVTQTCTVTVTTPPGDPRTPLQLLHLDFVPSGSWTFRASLEPQDFSDPLQEDPDKDDDASHGNHVAWPPTPPPTVPGV